MSIATRLLPFASLAALWTVADSHAATRSTTFNVSADVVASCAITLDDGARAASSSSNVDAAVATECSNRAPFNVARTTAQTAPFAASEATVSEGAPGRSVRITITF
jgi:hypothetical protein